MAYDSARGFSVLFGGNNHQSDTWLLGSLPCRADFDLNGQTAVPDIFAFLRAYFSSDPRADFDGVNGIQDVDVFAFLAAWFIGCE